MVRKRGGKNEGEEEGRGGEKGGTGGERRAWRGCRVAGGFANRSLAFRGNDAVREASHSAFLYHAIKAGLDMGMVNAGQLAVYQDIPKDLLELAEDIIFDRRPDATERLVEFAKNVSGAGAKREVDLAWREGAEEERLAYAVLHGEVESVEADAEGAGTKAGAGVLVDGGRPRAGARRARERLAQRAARRARERANAARAGRGGRRGATNSSGTAGWQPGGAI